MMKEKVISIIKIFQLIESIGNISVEIDPKMNLVENPIDESIDEIIK